MKFKNLKSLLLHFLVVVFVQTTAYSKKGVSIVPKVSITVENVTLNNFFSALEQKTKYHFNYGEDIITDSRKFSLSYQNATVRSEEHTSELQSRENLVCRLLLEKKNRE